MIERVCFVDNSISETLNFNREIFTDLSFDCKNYVFNINFKLRNNIVKRCNRVKIKPLLTYE